MNRSIAGHIMLDWLTRFMLICLVATLIDPMRSARATSGGTDASGCHNSATAGYHCHSAATGGSSSLDDYPSMSTYLLIALGACAATALLIVGLSSTAMGSNKPQRFAANPFEAPVDPFTPNAPGVPENLQTTTTDIVFTHRFSDLTMGILFRF